MIATFFSVLVALFLIFNPQSIQDVDFKHFGITVFVIGTLLFLTQYLVYFFAMGPLQKAEQNITPRVIQLLKHDHNLKYTSYFLCFFLLASYLVAIDIIFFETFSIKWLIAGWTILLGMSLDALHHTYTKVLNYLNPFEVMERYSKGAMKGIEANNEGEICDWIDAAGESATKAMARDSSSLSLLAIDEQRLIAKNYLEAAKSLVYRDTGKEEQISGAPDRVSYVLFYLFERFESLFHQALSKHNEPLCNAIISALGKIMIYAAHYDISIVDYPLHFLTKLAKLAQNHGMVDVGSRAELTILGVAKTIIKEVDLKYLEIKDPFISMINSMHELSKEAFKKDKSINIKILMQPFEDLKNAFNNEKVANHQDRPDIVQSIDRVLDEFATLQAVLSTMPPISEIMNPNPEA